MEALLHRRLHRLKNYIYDYEQIKDYTSSNISAMQNLNFLPAMKNPCFLTNDHILYEESGSERHGKLQTKLRVEHQLRVALSVTASYELN